MNRPKPMKSVGCWVWLVAALVCLSCGSQVLAPETPMDTPEHHCLTGMNLYERSDVNKALQEFERAKSLDPKYAPAEVGMGLCLAALNRFDEAFAALKRGRHLASTRDQKRMACCGALRVYTQWQGEGWLQKAEACFADAVRLDADDPTAYYYMAIAYKKARAYDKAAAHFKKVVDLDKGFVNHADMGWEAVQKVQRAMPETELGRRIAALDKVSRADVAALLVHELQLAALFRQKGAALKNSTVTEIDLPTDYQDHVLAADIEEVAGLAIRGLEPIGHRFDPDKAVTRANFAVIIEDILTRITRERELPTRFIGAKSPFADVDTSHYAFNAIVTCTTRGMMKADINGCFKGAQAVPGADALLILRRLKDAATDKRL